MSTLFDALLEYNGFTQKSIKDIAEKKIKIKMSAEQQAIIDALASNSVIVNAVAGSGKTSTVIGLAMQTNKKILQLTYNAELKFEVREKSCNLFDVESYHSLSYNNYGLGKNDEELLQVLKRDLKPSTTKHYDIIVIDEAQDMSRLYYNIVQKFITDMKLQSAKFLIMGDVQQAINMFIGADYRYLTMAANIFKSPSKFVFKHLNTSFRLTNETAKFVGDCTGREIKTIKRGPMVKYIHHNAEFINNYLFKIIASHDPNDIFVLMPSVRSAEHYSRDLEHMLVKNKIPCYISIDEKVNKKVSANKVVFTTINQSKGRERKIVIIYNFDESYKFYDKKSDDSCSNLLYVAMTRATDQLILCHQLGNNKLDFVDTSKIDFIGEPITMMPKQRPILLYNKDIDNITKYIKEDIIEQLQAEIEYIDSPVIEDLDIPEIAEFDKTNEAVSKILNMALPIYWSLHRYNYNPLDRLMSLSEIGSLMRPNSLDTDTDTDNQQDIIRQVITKIAKDHNIHFQLEQIKHLEWLTPEIISGVIQNFADLEIDPTTMYKKIGCTINYKDMKEYKFNITGQISAADNLKTVYNFICAENITLSHMLQSAFMAFILDNNQTDVINFSNYTFNNSKIYKILNIKTGVVRQVQFKNIKNIIEILLKRVITPYSLESDSKFLFDHQLHL